VQAAAASRPPATPRPAAEPAFKVHDTPTPASWERLIAERMLPAEEPGTSEGRTAATNHTVRSVFVVGPDKKIKLHLTYPMTTGRNFNEILRVLDSMQLTAAHKVATPANWQDGEDVIIVASVSDAEAKEKYPDGWKTLKPYLRIVPQPGKN